VDGANLRMVLGNARVPLSATSRMSFVTAGGERLEISGHGDARLTDRFGMYEMFAWTPAEPVALTSDALQPLLGVYQSDDAETTLTVALGADRASLVILRRPDTQLPLTPLYRDAFTSPDLGVVVFHRDDKNRVNDLSVSQDRVWDLPFTRVTQITPTAKPASGRFGKRGARE
jgi:hypothetical protein